MAVKAYKRQSIEYILLRGIYADHLQFAANIGDLVICLPFALHSALRRTVT